MQIRPFAICHLRNRDKSWLRQHVDDEGRKTFLDSIARTGRRGHPLGEPSPKGSSIRLGAMEAHWMGVLPNAINLIQKDWLARLGQIRDFFSL